MEVLVAEGGDRELLERTTRKYFEKLLNLNISDYSKINSDVAQQLSDPEMRREELRDLMKSIAYPEGWFYVERAAVIAEVWTLLDGECTEDTRAKLRQHLDDCPTCLRYYGVEERIKALIATKCSGEKAPQYLLERVRLEISRTTIIRRG